MRRAEWLYRIAPCAAASILVAVMAGRAAAQPYLCVAKAKWNNKGTGRVIIRNTPCGPMQEDVTASAQGAIVEDVYGDGAMGDLKVEADVTLNTADHPDLQYKNITVDEGITLSVPSGTVLRCSGQFVNNGTIEVNPHAKGAWRNGGVTTATLMPAGARAAVGVSAGAPGQGELAAEALAVLSGGRGGVGLSEFIAAGLRHPGANAGGGGELGSMLPGNSDFTTAGDGGGSLVVLCKGALVNHGTIIADGAASEYGGGGGGGIVILASATSITNSVTAAVVARGGDGADSTSRAGANGGGGGGIVHLIAPSIADSGVVVVDGGNKGEPGAEGSVSTLPRAAGGGGGACGGDGGRGGDVLNDGTPDENAANGSAGHFVSTLADPTALF